MEFLLALRTPPSPRRAGAANLAAAQTQAAELWQRDQLFPDVLARVAGVIAARSAQ